MKSRLVILFILATCFAAAVTTTRYYAYQSGPAFEIFPTDVPTSLGDVVTSDARVNEITLTNTTDSAITVTVQDKQGTPKAYLSSVSVAARTTFVIESPGLRLFPGGISWQASDAGIVGYISWR